MDHSQHAEAAERRLLAIQPARSRLAELAELAPKTPEQWAEVAELKLQLQLAYDGASVHAHLAMHGALVDLIGEVRGAFGKAEARELVRRLADGIQQPDPDRAGEAPETRRRMAAEAVARVQ